MRTKKLFPVIRMIEISY